MLKLLKPQYYRPGENLKVIFHTWRRIPDAVVYNRNINNTKISQLKYPLPQFVHKNLSDMTRRYSFGDLKSSLQLTSSR